MESEILSHLLRYIRGQESLTELEDWFVPATWQIHQTGDRDAVAVSRRVSLRLAEFLNGHWTENELKDRFSELLLARARPMATSIFIPAAHVVANTSNPGEGGAPWYALPGRRNVPGIALSGTPATLLPRPRTVSGNPQIDTGRRLRRPA
ncbi:MAG: hypothetical protein ACREMB_04110 [Candidatus Rokuibacteriota bacterium]